WRVAVAPNTGGVVKNSDRWFFRRVAATGISAGFDRSEIGQIWVPRRDAPHGKFPSALDAGLGVGITLRGMIKISAYNERLDLVDIEFRFIRFALDSLRPSRKAEFFRTVSEEEMAHLERAIETHAVGILTSAQLTDIP